jgi:predicted RecB family nuclease
LHDGHHLPGLRAEHREAQDLVLGSAVLLQGDALKRVDGASKLGDHHYVPVLHNDGDKVGRRQKLLLAALGLAVARVQGLRPADGLVAHGPEARLGRVHLGPKLYRRAEQILGELNRLQTGGEPPRLTLNGHCQVCEFRQRCHAQAAKDDDLSLLRGMSEREINTFSAGRSRATQMEALRGGTPWWSASCSGAAGVCL